MSSRVNNFYYFPKSLVDIFNKKIEMGTRPRRSPLSTPLDMAWQSGVKYVRFLLAWLIFTLKLGNTWTNSVETKVDKVLTFFHLLERVKESRANFFVHWLQRVCTIIVH